MIPLSDDVPTLETPWMTYVILGITWATWLIVQGAGMNLAHLAATVCDYGLVPGEITHQAVIGTAIPMGEGLACVVDDHWINVLTPITSMFLHGGWMHILGNSLFLWVFGNNVEDAMGHWRFLFFYLICGVAAAMTHVFLHPASPIPMVGASGAISGVMGAYLLLYPRARVNMLWIFAVFPLPAWLVLIYWFGLQLLAGVPELTHLRPDVASGVAVWAHVGGFVVGTLLILIFRDPARLLAHRQRFGVPGETPAYQ